MEYTPKLFCPADRIYEFRVPASKSILNRALVLAAFSDGKTELRTSGPFGDDTRDLLSCLEALGVPVHIGDVLRVSGGAARTSATLNVGNAGTAARFLTAMLAFRGGEYEMHASPQMSARPMDLIGILRQCGVRFRFFGEPDRFPFFMKSDGIRADNITVDTDVSTQFASGLMLAAATGDRPLTLHLTGSRTHGSYLKMTRALLERFGAAVTERGDQIEVTPFRRPPASVEIEADLSAACYFIALALLCRCAVFVHGVSADSLQGDAAFLRLLRSKGVVLTQTADGVLADGRKIASFSGFDVDLHDFSDQTLTVAALAPFASGPSVLRNVAHIRVQECDRMRAISDNLTSLGVPVRIEGGDIFISPAPVRAGVVKTFGDHRVAMAFALIGLKTGKITVDDPECCRKTFPGYFEILSALTDERA